MRQVGIIGLGHVAVHQVEAIQRSAEFQLRAGCDRNQERHHILGKSAEAFFTVEDLLEKCDGLDVVVVASPNQSHVSHGICVMSSGKWPLIEKPLAETAEDFQYFALQRRRLSAKSTIALHAAFGRETEWFRNEASVDVSEWGTLTSISSAFYDPYVQSGELLAGAGSLGGSWTDSGINVFSVIGRVVDLQDIEIKESRMTRDDGGVCRELDAVVTYSFNREGARGTGEIRTSWQNGRNKKVTALTFDFGKRSIVLDHSEEMVILRENGKDKIIFQEKNGLPRLTNHYIGVFSDLARQMDTGEDNFEYGYQLHDLLYRARRLADWNIFPDVRISNSAWAEDY